jgi:hypothetical protein
MQVHFTGCHRQGETFRRCSIYTHPVFGLVAVPQQADAKLPCPGRGRLAGPYQKLTTVGVVHNSIGGRGSRADYHDLVDPWMCGETVRGANSGLTGDEDTDLHEGWTGVQVSAVSLEESLRIRTRMIAAPRPVRIQTRLTRSVYDDPS